MKKVLFFGTAFAAVFFIGAVIGTEAYLERLVSEYECGNLKDDPWVFYSKINRKIYEIDVECMGD